MIQLNHLISEDPRHASPNIFLSSCLLVASVGAQEDKINGIVEGLRQLENEYGCEGGDLLACLKSSGLECSSSGDDIGSTICSSTAGPIFKIYERTPKEWVVVILWERPTNKHY